MPTDSSRLVPLVSILLVAAMAGPPFSGGAPGATTDPVHSVVFSITRKPILPVTVHGAIFAGGVPVFEHVGHVNSRELGDGLARALGARRAVLIKMHGAVIVGGSVEEAFAAALQLEENAEKQLWAEATGRAEPMTPEEAERCVRQSFSPFSVAKRWQYHVDKERMSAAGHR